MINYLQPLKYISSDCKFSLLSNARGSVNLQVSIPSARTTVYGLKIITFQSCQEWNFFINYIRDKTPPTKSKNICKKILTDFSLNSY